MKEEHPELKTSEIMTKLGEMWKNLSAEDKIQWNEKAEEDKKRYETEKAAYVPTPSDEVNSNLLELSMHDLF